MNEIFDKPIKVDKYIAQNVTKYWCSNCLVDFITQPPNTKVIGLGGKFYHYPECIPQP